MASLLEKDQIGKREDLADLIALVDAHDCPLVSGAKKGAKPGNTLMQWQADSYASAVSTGTVDGTDVGSSDYQNPGENRAILSNYVRGWRPTQAQGWGVPPNPTGATRVTPRQRRRLEFAIWP